jgi:hypothetical protein
MGIGLNSLIIENDISSIMNQTIEDRSLTIYTIGYLREMNTTYREANKEMYRAIYEADNFVAVNEAFSDFFQKIKDIIKSFIKYIKSLFERFITTLHRIVNSEKYLIKKEDVLKKFNSDHEFDYDGYEFTIEPNIPVCDALVEFNSEFVKLDLSQLGADNRKNKDKLKELYKNVKDEIDGEKYDKLRGKVIGQPDRAIYQSDFSSELFELFRNNMDSTSIFTVDNAKVMECFRDMKDYKETEKNVKKTKKELENQYKQIEKQIDRMVSSERTAGGFKVKSNDGAVGGTEATLDNDSMNQLNLYVKALTNQITEMSTIHSIAFSQKLDALKDKYVQDKRILYIALSKIEKDKKFIGGEL